MDNAISVSRNNLVYFSVVPRDGIFEIDLPNSNTIDSSMYAVSNKRAKLILDSALLWHCRLDTLARNALRRSSIKSLRSDREGEYISQEFFDHLKEHGIIAHRTPPYTPQHNGVSERRNRTLLDMVHSMLSQTTLPKSFWDYSLETVARILNMVSTKKVKKTPYEDDLEIDEPQSDIIPIRRSTRTRNAPNRMCLYIDAEEHELGDLGKPANYKAASFDPESDKWLNAMNVEMQSMKDNEVWDLIDLYPNGKTVGSKLLLKKKTNMDGVVHTFKARLIAKGFTQTYEVDYEETFSTVVDIRAIRILIAIAAYYDYEIWQM
ncbi:retrotransposon protein, putative, ty1-copia subclass, partial [Tanacetum coccineum]